MFLSVQRYIGDRLVEPRASWTEPGPDLSFRVTVRCVRSNPDRFTARLQALDVTLFEVGPFDSYEKAVSSARGEIGLRFARLFADPA